jgi:dihydroorotate dehydrogenase electron transfer subunit
MPVDVVAAILSNIRLSPDYNVIALAAPAIAREAAPGQFVMVRASVHFDPLLRRPFSIFERLRGEDGDIRGLSLLNKRVGAGTTMLYEAKAGDCVSVVGPLGRPFVPVDPPADAWLVAGGVGLAPFVTLAESLAARGTPTTLFYGARSAGDLYYADFFREIGVRVVLTTEDGSLGETGRVTGSLARALAERSPGAAPALYACGPTPMMRAVAELGAQAGVSVAVSLEPVMGCGMGGCYSCVVPVRSGGASHFVRSCIEGPVFDAATLVWDGLAGH